MSNANDSKVLYKGGKELRTKCFINERRALGCNVGIWEISKSIKNVEIIKIKFLKNLKG